MKIIGKGKGYLLKPEKLNGTILLSYFLAVLLIVCKFLRYLI